MKTILRDLKNRSYEPVEVKVREATCNDNWGAPSTLMGEIADATHDRSQYALLFRMLWKRLRDHQQVMHVKKALILVEYLVRNGSERFVRDAQHRADDINKLKAYRFYDDHNQDLGGPIRKKAAQVYLMLTDPQMLEQERERGRNIRNVKTSAISSDTYGRTSASSQQRSSHGEHHRHREKESKATRDPYDMYSNTARALASADAGPPKDDSPERHHHHHKKKASHSKKSKAATPDDNPFDNSADADDPFGGADASGSGKKKDKKPKKEKKEKEKKKKHSKKHGKKDKHGDAPRAPSMGQDDFAAAFEEATVSDPFDPFSGSGGGGAGGGGGGGAQPQRLNASNLDATLDAMFAAAEPQHHQQAQASKDDDFDFLTGDFVPTSLDDPFQDGGGGSDPFGADDDDDTPAATGRVVWGLDAGADDEQPESGASAAASGDVWDLAGDLMGDLTGNPSSEASEAKKKAAMRKTGASMADRKAQRGTVIQGDASGLADFAAPAAPAAAPHQAYGYPQPQPGYHPQQPGYGYPPQHAGYGFPPPQQQQPQQQTGYGYPPSQPNNPYGF